MQVTDTGMKNNTQYEIIRTTLFYIALKYILATQLVCACKENGVW